MRVSEFYHLNKNQAALDFVDVDIFGDTRYFIDPSALRQLQFSWGQECVSLIQSFFQEVINAIRNNDHKRAYNLLAVLHEPNETHLGLSRGKAQGHAMSDGLASGVLESLSTSEAVKSGLLVDLEDSVLMVEGVASDVISDIVTNVIRGPLINYTQQIANEYGIPLVENIDSGPIWDQKELKWIVRYESLPITENGKLLLVPKIIIRRKLSYSQGEYYWHFILTELQEQELSANTELVKLIRSKHKTRKVVYKKDVRNKFGYDKKAIVEITRKNPSILEKYRVAKRKEIISPLEHEDFSADREGVLKPRWDDLIQQLNAIRPGTEQAGLYNDIIEQILTSLFYPQLFFPKKQLRIHEGRKIIDIGYVNEANKGFFHWLSMNYAAPHIFVECKNYSSDPQNPELDQISGRFSPSRGVVGFIVCRSFSNKSSFIEKCRDTADDHRGFVMPFDDSDIITLINKRKVEDWNAVDTFLRTRFNKLIM